ncbi:hypothetical protein FRC19_004611, partial [Serendipita sp. 401]
VEIHSTLSTLPGRKELKMRVVIRDDRWKANVKRERVEREMRGRKLRVAMQKRDGEEREGEGIKLFQFLESWYEVLLSCLGVGVVKQPVLGKKKNLENKEMVRDDTTCRGKRSQFDRLMFQENLAWICAWKLNGLDQI